MSWQFLLFNTIALLCIAFIIWWFFLAKPQVAIATSEEITILVKDGVYQPSLIQVRAGRAIKLNFLRTDPTPCASSVLFPQFNTAYALPFNEKVSITIPPQASGNEIDFNCQMGMFRGKVMVE